MMCVIDLGQRGILHILFDRDELIVPVIQEHDVLLTLLDNQLGLH